MRIADGRKHTAASTAGTGGASYLGGFGYGRFTLHNRTTLEYKFVSVAPRFNLTDHFFITRPSREAARG